MVYFFLLKVSNHSDYSKILTANNYYLNLHGFNKIMLLENKLNLPLEKNLQIDIDSCKQKISPASCSKDILCQSKIHSYPTSSTIYFLS